MDADDNKLGRVEWTQVMEKLGASLAQKKAKAELCLMGSTPLMMHSTGRNWERTTIDCDIYADKSTFDAAILRQCASEIGMPFNPKSDFEQQKPYIQIIERKPQSDPGVFKDKDMFDVGVFGGGALVIKSIPPQNHVAIKLAVLNGDNSLKHLRDIDHIIDSFSVTDDSIKTAIKSLLSPTFRDAGRDNFETFIVQMKRAGVSLDPSRSLDFGD